MIPAFLVPFSVLLHLASLQKLRAPASFNITAHSRSKLQQAPQA
jgi:hypothetical protein